MNFMNLNQAAPGDREAGFMHTRLRLADRRGHNLAPLQAGPAQRYSTISPEASAEEPAIPTPKPC